MSPRKRATSRSSSPKPLAVVPWVRRITPPSSRTSTYVMSLERWSDEFVVRYARLPGAQRPPQWVIEARDDVGGVYRIVGSSYESDSHRLTGQWRFRPALARRATRLTLSITGADWAHSTRVTARLS